MAAEYMTMSLINFSFQDCVLAYQKMGQTGWAGNEDTEAED